MVETLGLFSVRRTLLLMVMFLAIGTAVGVVIGYIMVAQCYSTLNEVLGSLKAATAEFEKLSYSYKLSFILDTVELVQWNSLSTVQALSLKYIVQKVNITYEVSPELYVSRAKEILYDRIKVFNQTKPVEGLEENHDRIMSLLTQLSEEVDDMYKIAAKEHVTDKDISDARKILGSILTITDKIRREVESATSKL